MTVYAITDTKKGRTGIAPTYLHTTRLSLPWNFRSMEHSLLGTFVPRERRFQELSLGHMKISRRNAVTML